MFIEMYFFYIYIFIRWGLSDITSYKTAFRWGSVYFFIWFFTGLYWGIEITLGLCDVLRFFAVVVPLVGDF